MIEAGGAGLVSDSLEKVRDEIVTCERCPRLREHCRTVAVTKRRAFAGEEYWGRPVPGFGDPGARLLVVGLAPAAHGANRTGRMFTGDSSGNWLYRALHRFGFSSRAESKTRSDGLTLRGAYIAAVGRCAPPQNKLTVDEIRSCRPYLERELRLLPELKVVLCLGRVAYDTCAAIFCDWGWVRKKEIPSFSHGISYSLGEGRPHVLASYHPSRQNTQTGLLTEEMLDAVVGAARRYAFPDEAGTA